MMRDGRAMRGIVRRWICVALCGGTATMWAAKDLRGLAEHRDGAEVKGVAEEAL